MHTFLNNIVAGKKILVIVFVLCILVYLFYRMIVSYVSNTEQKQIDIALRSIEGSGIQYDTSTSPVVEQREGYYIVTFPLPKQQDHLVRTGDFAVQIWIDKKTEEVVKRIVAP
jgi:hypothetical protein